MKVHELSRLVEEVEALFKAANARGQSADLSAVRAWLESAPGEDVAAFLDSARTKAEAERLTKLQVVSAWVKRLKDAGLNEDEFEKELGALSADKAVLKDEAVAIARSYAKTRQSIPTKAKAFATIRAKFIELAQAESKSRIIDSKHTTPW